MADRIVVAWRRRRSNRQHHRVNIRAAISADRTVSVMKFTGGQWGLIGVPR
jgi:hypothetical protein